jgi:hypothetical protein
MGDHDEHKGNQYARSNSEKNKVFPGEVIPGNEIGRIDIKKADEDGIGDHNTRNEDPQVMHAFYFLRMGQEQDGKENKGHPADNMK